MGIADPVPVLEVVADDAEQHAAVGEPGPGKFLDNRERGPGGGSAGGAAQVGDLGDQ